MHGCHIQILLLDVNLDEFQALPCADQVSIYPQHIEKDHKHTMKF